jgi:hypothetical protein
MTLSKKFTYLGDGLWASTDGFQVALTADQGSAQERTVYLESNVVAAFLDYLRDNGLNPRE